MGEIFKRGGKNPHMRRTQKQPCEECGQMADHYPDGTISAHKIYEYKKEKGVLKRTGRWHYCSNKRWD